ncbi:MAG: chemotaxis protein CheW [Thermodesulfobacteriota bacterium]
MKTIRSKYIHPDFQFVRFRMGDCDFGIDIKDLKEIIRYRDITEVPGTPSFVEGFIRLRSMAVPVIDLRKRFGIEPQGGEPTRIMIILLGGHVAGLIVDEVADIIAGGTELKLKSEGQAGGRGAQPWSHSIEAVLEADGRHVHIIRLQELLTGPELRFFDTPVPEDAIP